MKNSNLLKTFLVISGLLLTFIGGATLLIPATMKADAGIDISGNINMLNDTRAFSALLLFFAILIVSGAFVKKLTYTATVVSFLLFLSIGIGRLISILLDGMPSDGLTKATVLEFVLGILGLILFNLYRKKSL